MAAICHKSWATPLPPSILLSFLPCRGLSKSPGVWAEPAHLLPNILMQFIPSNSFLKCTLVFNVLQKLSVHAEFSHCLQNCSTMDYRPFIAAWHYKWVGGPCTFGPPTARKWIGQDPRTPTESPPLHLLPPSTSFDPKPQRNENLPILHLRQILAASLPVIQ